jgi:putative membrane protein
MKRGALWCIVIVASVCISDIAWAHSLLNSNDNTNRISEIAFVDIPILVAAMLYAKGALVLFKRAKREPSRVLLRALSFACGLIVLALALVSRLDDWGAELFALHMVQHEVLMLIAAPLLVLGRPLPVILWAFSGSRRAALAGFSQKGIVKAVWGLLSAPIVAWLLHALALWIWHAPALFSAVLISPAVHDLQHFTFFATALLFWTALFQERRRDHQGAGILYLFTTTVHSGVLGALITFAQQPWYSAYLQTSQAWGFTALEDQQLGGLIMWVPSSLVYVGAALVLLSRWISASERPGRATRPGTM